MLSGSILLSCLLLAADNGASSEPVYMSSAKFEIPVTIAPERRNDIREIVLYEATPTKENPQPQFRRITSLTPREDHFPINNATEGMHWFNIQIHYRNGKVDPTTPTPAGALKIIVDTTRPDIRIGAERRDDMIVARWELCEEYPDKPTLRMGYQTPEMPSDQWTLLAIKPGPKGEITFDSPGPSPIRLRMTLKDLAGNEGKGEYVLPAAAPTVAVQPPGPGVWQAGVNSALKPTDPLPPPLPTPPPISQYNQPILPVAPQQADRIAPAAPAGQLGFVGPLAGVSGSLLPLTVVSRSHITVEFDVTRYGPSGLGSADVWLTADDGQTWEKRQSDEPLMLPQGDQPLGGPIKAGVMVKIPQAEVPYGIYLVVKSKAGVGLPPPQRNTPPHMRVELDTLNPKAELRYPPVPKPGYENILIISWEAKDKNLEANPITLEYSEVVTGPWKPIGVPLLPNTGHFEWRVTPDIPGKVFLRMTVRDRGGLASVAVTPEPVVVDTTIPIFSDVHVKGN